MSRVFGVFGAAALMVGIALEAGAVEIGKTTAVNPSATGTPPAAAARVLQVGTDMQASERVVTTADGRAHLLFLDGSSLTVGPNSDLTLDKYVYDPGTKTGEIVFNTTKGLFRLVGGRISKKTPVLFNTPTASVGIRGGIAMVSVGAATTATYLFGDGLTISTTDRLGQAITERLVRPGYKVEIGAGGAVSAPVRVSAQELSATAAQFEGSATATTGGGPAVSDGQVAQTNLSALGSENDPASVSLDAGAGFAENGVGLDVAETEDSANLTRASQDQAVEQSGGATVTGLGGRYNSDFPYLISTFDSNTLSASPDPSRNITFSGGKIEKGRFLVTLNGHTLDLPATPSKDEKFQSTGTASPFGPVSGDYFVADDLSFVAYQLFEENFGGNLAVLFAGKPFTGTLPTSGVASYSLNFSQDFSLAKDISGVFSDQDASNLHVVLSPNIGPSFPDGQRSTWLYGLLAINGQGASQTSALIGGTGVIIRERQVENGPRDGNLELTGFSRGTVRVGHLDRPDSIRFGTTSMRDGDGNSFFGPSGEYFAFATGQSPATGSVHDPDRTGGVFQLGSSNQTEPFFVAGFGERVSSPAELGSTRTVRDLSGFTAGLAEVQAGGAVSEFVFTTTGLDSAVPSQAATLKVVTSPSENTVFASFQIRDVDQAQPQSTYLFGRAEGGSGTARSAFIDNRVYALRDAQTSAGTLGSDPIDVGGGIVITSEVANTDKFLPSGVSFCQCKFLDWGYWSSAVRTGANASDPFRREHVHIATWVAGEIPDAVNVPTSGSATYTGHAIGNVSNNGSKYIAAGRFQHQWDFGARSGSVTISNFDNTDYAGATVAPNSPTEFQGGFQSVSGRTGVLTGSFYRGGGDAVAEQGGHFTITGSGYKAGGTFAASK